MRLRRKPKPTVKPVSVEGSYCLVKDRYVWFVDEGRPVVGMPATMWDRSRLPATVPEP